MTKDQMKNLLHMDEDKLLFKIWEEGLSATHAFPESPKRKIRTALEWYIKRIPQIQKHICNDAKIKDFFTKNDDLILLAAIADLLSSLSFGVSPYTLAALVVKRGLSTLCIDVW